MVTGRVIFSPEDQAETKRHGGFGTKKQFTLSDGIMLLGVTILMGLSVREQLQVPPEERTWHGTLFGIPYDFHWPTIERLRETIWNKETARVLVPQFFGMGWTINFYPLINPTTAKHMPEAPVTK